MPTVHTDCQWGVLGYSQRGASHVRQALPNQDAIAHCVAEDGSPPVILAVADGHGSSKSFRSDVGAQFAVATAVEVCREFLDAMQGTELSTVKSEAELRIPPRIFLRWRQRVVEHFGQNPFTDAELTRLAEQAGGAARERATRPEQLPVAYGATLLVAVVTSQFLICFQLGDGDILAVSDSTGIADYAIPKDETLIANETTSLCQKNGERYVRYRFQLLQDSPPGMVLLSTDGYSNSFANPDAFLKAGADYLGILRTEGADEVEKNLPAWLEETSRSGSGDDITVGIIYRRSPPLGKVEAGQATSETPVAITSSGPKSEARPTSDGLDAAPAQPLAFPNRESRLAKTLANVAIIATGALIGAILVFVLLVVSTVLYRSLSEGRMREGIFNTILAVESQMLGDCPWRDKATVWFTLSAGAALGGLLFAWAKITRVGRTSRGTAS